MKKTRIAMAAALALLATACGGGISGTFEDELGMSSYTFHGGGRVVQSAALAGVEIEMKYEVDGDQVRLTHPEAAGATLVLTRIDDDTLSGPMGLRFKRKD